MKKFLSLALALALCFSLTVPAFAANKAGDTTVTDKSGNIYTLSKPILYTIPVSDLEAIQGSSYILNRIKEETSVVYAVSTGTVITAPNGGWIDSMLGVWLTQEGDACKVDEDDGGGYPWKSFEYEDGSQGLLSSFPSQLVMTICFDRGVSFATWRKIAERLHCDVYFCRSLCGWQAGTNENLIGLLREFCAKGRNLSRVAPSTLKRNLAFIHGRPRKVLNFHSAQELWQLELNSCCT